ncbi:hypothetical protein BDV25DRAFT_147513 [Aspergillus avenaceus]|uniref:Uncharacterized protein n=1 Tax=Aspergillus avenaceus TaxID=36643 RepID=A0A5N6U7H9_ASPAV|nr:hypothetical protein BDV25DRAFT_147513 [Aspergillus avenaceus]
MGLLKIALKAILIPIITLLVITVAVIFFIKKRKSRKEKERSIENGFQPPPIVQWVPNQDIQKPVPAAYVSQAHPTG